MTQVMRDLPFIARRLATGLPVWAVARDCGLPEAELGHLMWEPRFRELVGAWEDVFALSPEQRTERLVRLAHLILEDALARQDLRAVLYVDRESRRRRHPVESLAQSFANIVEHEQARAARRQAAIDAGEETPEVPPPPRAAVAGPERPAPHPVDRALSRKAAALRGEMLDGLVIEHAVEQERLRQLRLTPVAPHELPGWQPPEDEREPSEPAELAVEDEAVEDAEDVEDERDLEAEAAARAAFCATMARLPEGIRERVQTLPPQEMRRFILALAEGSFPGLDLDREAQPQGP
jgi:hypothetical protein